MLFKKQICNQCGTEFDATKANCPQCGESNKSLEKGAIGDGYISINWPYQLACFLVGTMGLALFAILWILMLKPFYEDAVINEIVNFYVYGTMFVCLTPIVVINIKEFIPKFKKIKPYLIGLLLGFGLIVFSYIYGMLISLIPIENTINENEALSESIISHYPVISIFVIGMIGPICEELTYRVGIFSLANRVNRVLAYIVGILVFAFAHMNFTGNVIVELLNLPQYLVAAFIFCFAYDRWSLPCSLTAHLTNNLFAVIFQIIYEGLLR